MADIEEEIRTKAKELVQNLDPYHDFVKNSDCKDTPLSKFAKEQGKAYGYRVKDSKDSKDSKDFSTINGPEEFCYQKLITEYSKEFDYKKNAVPVDASSEIFLTNPDDMKRLKGARFIKVSVPLVTIPKRGRNAIPTAEDIAKLQESHKGFRKLLHALFGKHIGLFHDATRGNQWSSLLTDPLDLIQKEWMTLDNETHIVLLANATSYFDSSNSVATQYYVYQNVKANHTLTCATAALPSTDPWNASRTFAEQTRITEGIPESVPLQSYGVNYEGDTSIEFVDPNSTPPLTAKWTLQSIASADSKKFVYSISKLCQYMVSGDPKVFYDAQISTSSDDPTSTLFPRINNIQTNTVLLKRAALTKFVQDGMQYRNVAFLDTLAHTSASTPFSLSLNQKEEWTKPFDAILGLTFDRMAFYYAIADGQGPYILQIYPDPAKIASSPNPVIDYVIAVPHRYWSKENPDANAIVNANAMKQAEADAAKKRAEEIRNLLIGIKQLLTDLASKTIPDTRLTFANLADSSSVEPLSNEIYIANAHLQSCLHNFEGAIPEKLPETIWVARIKTFKDMLETALDTLGDAETAATDKKTDKKTDTISSFFSILNDYFDIDLRNPTWEPSFYENSFRYEDVIRWLYKSNDFETKTTEQQNEEIIEVSRKVNAMMHQHYLFYYDTFKIEDLIELNDLFASQQDRNLERDLKKITTNLDWIAQIEKHKSIVFGILNPPTKETKKRARDPAPSNEPKAKLNAGDRTEISNLLGISSSEVGYAWGGATRSAIYERLKQRIEGSSMETNTERQKGTKPKMDRPWIFTFQQWFASLWMHGPNDQACYDTNLFILRMKYVEMRSYCLDYCIAAYKERIRNEAEVLGKIPQTNQKGGDFWNVMGNLFKNFKTSEKPEPTVQKTSEPDKPPLICTTLWTQLLFALDVADFFLERPLLEPESSLFKERLNALSKSQVYNPELLNSVMQDMLLTEDEVNRVNEWLSPTLERIGFYLGNASWLAAERAMLYALSDSRLSYLMFKMVMLVCPGIPGGQKGGYMHPAMQLADYYQKYYPSYFEKYYADVSCSNSRVLEFINPTP